MLGNGVVRRYANQQEARKVDVKGGGGGRRMLIAAGRKVDVRG